jgi:hypothetical protein
MVMGSRGLRKASLLALLGIAASPGGFDPGIGVGETIPSFAARDQGGKLRSFADLVGPSGLILLFYRSADW